MYDNLNIQDVKLLIDRLMVFIVLEGKEFVDEEEKENYVKSYLSLFVKMINEPIENNNKNMSKAAMMEHIFNDMDKYIK